ncbi:MFS transporter [Camelliibacillus cellulosilyticus]|uniref:MFS transporter n=1 Tax=Camelliibacillus cellulosilyticus TaxID=2174486 RepID=A0ABV9GKW2_9BACL
MTIRRFVVAQSLLMTAGSVVFPFYLLLIKNIGDSYAQFGWAYGLFTLTAAMIYPVIGRLSDKIGDQKLLLFYTWGMAALMLLIPLITEVWEVYLIQIVMGFLGAVQKVTEKTVLARETEKRSAGKRIGNYHLWVSLCSAAGIILTGYLVDFLTIATLFYVASILYLIASFVIWRRTSKPLVGENNWNRKSG